MGPVIGLDVAKGTSVATALRVLLKVYAIRPQSSGSFSIRKKAEAWSYPVK